MHAGKMDSLTTDQVVEEIKTADLHMCSLRVREVAYHCKDDHKCRESYRVLKAIEDRSEWFHQDAMKRHGLLEPPTIQ